MYGFISKQYNIAYFTELECNFTKMMQNENHSDKFIKIPAGENELSYAFLLAFGLFMLSACHLGILGGFFFFVNQEKKKMCHESFFQASVSICILQR